MPSHVKLSIVIVSHNSEQFVKNCCSSLYSQKTSFPFEVILVDNDSNDRTVQIVREQFPHTTIISRTNTGFAAGNNAGIRHATGELVLLLNPDTILHDGSMETLVAHFSGHPRIGALGPKIFNADGTVQRTGVSFPALWNAVVEIFFLDIIFPSSKIFGRHRKLYVDPDTTHEAEYLQGSCLMLRRDVFEEIGLLDENFFIYFEETDLCYRLKQKGWRVVYDPAASIVHYGGSGVGFYGKDRLIEFHRSYLIFLTKHYTVPSVSVFRVVLFLRSFVRVMIFLIASLFLLQRRQEFLSRAKGYGEVLLMMLGVKK
jgi:GT2 family glycosyltransferase